MSDSEATTETLFVGESDFCSECGAILPLPGKSDVIKCKVCKVVVDVGKFHGMQIRSTINFKQKETTSVVPKEDSQGPMVDRKCIKCGCDKMMYATLQTRSADEGQTIFYTCPRCQFKETENS